MFFPEPVDRNVSSFLNIYDFINLRKTCRQHYFDTEAYNIRAWSMPFQMSEFDSRQTIALHYLMSYAIQFKERLGSNAWYQRIVNWLNHKSSIRLMYTFICKQNIDFLFKINMSLFSGRQRIIWLRLMHRNQILRKQRLYKYGLYNENEHHACGFLGRPTKRRRHWYSSDRDLQPCY